MSTKEKTDYITLLRETAMRSQLTSPLNDQEVEWFDEGINSDFMIRLITTLDEVRP